MACHLQKEVQCCAVLLKHVSACFQNRYRRDRRTSATQLPLWQVPPPTPYSVQCSSLPFTNASCIAKRGQQASVIPSRSRANAVRCAALRLQMTCSMPPARGARTRVRFNSNWRTWYSLTQLQPEHAAAVAARPAGTGSVNHCQAPLEDHTAVATDHSNSQETADHRLQVDAEVFELARKLPQPIFQVRLPEHGRQAGVAAAAPGNSFRKA